MLVARERLCVDDLVAGAPKPGHDGFQVRHQQARMCLPGWSKVAVHAKMNLHVSALEPSATANDEVRGLRPLGNAQEARVEDTRLLFSSRGHCQLNMVQTNDCHSGSPIMPVQRAAVEVVESTAAVPPFLEDAVHVEGRRTRRRPERRS